MLTGGRSTRMGTDKLRLPLGDRTMAEHAVRKLRALGVGEILLAGGNLKISGTVSVGDIYPGAGPLAGIHAGLKRARKETVFVLGADTPLVPETLLSAMLAHHRSSGNDITIAAHGEKYEPLIGVYERRVFSIAERLLNEKRYSVRGLWKTHTVAFFPWHDETAFLNCNTREDYERVLAVLGQQNNI